MSKFDGKEHEEFFFKVYEGNYYHVGIDNYTFSNSMVLSYLLDLNISLLEKKIQFQSLHSHCYLNHELNFPQQITQKLSYSIIICIFRICRTH